MSKKLTQVERERLADSQLKIQSVSQSLKHVAPHKVPCFDEIKECLEGADKCLDEALRSVSNG